MVNGAIRVGEQYKINDILYTVIGFKNDIIVFVETKSTSIIFFCAKFDDFLEQLNSGRVSKEQVDEKYIDTNLLSEYRKKGYKENLDFINEINQTFGPYYLDIKQTKHSPSFADIRNKYNFSRKKAWHLIRKYLQSGLNPFSLVPEKGINQPKERNISTKLGRPSTGDITVGIIRNKEVDEHFDEAIKLYLNNRASTIKDAYDSMLLKYYTFSVSDKNTLSKRLLPVNQRPTYTQFYNYLTSHIEKDEIEKAKTTKREQRNNSRLLLSDNLNNVNGPYSLVEVDECEVDVFLVSREDPNIVIGRPIVYVMIDIFTRLIVGVSVSLENNSIRGITNCLLNLIDDKKKLCEKYGIDSEDGIWPDRYIPVRIRCDYGSEYISKEFERICNELNIQREVVTPGTGSLKGQVEQMFHQLHSGQNADFNNKGLIEKRYDSTHKTKACLNIEEFKKIVYSAVVKHNCSYMENYPLTKDMRKKKILPIPYELWKYGINKYGEPKSIINDNSFRFTLLENVKASVSRDGVTYKGLKYIQEDDEYLLGIMVKAGTKRLPFNCRIDSRCIRNIYYTYNNQVRTLHLNYAKTGMIDYAELTLAEYEKILADKKKNDKAGKDLNQQLAIQHKSLQQEVIKEAKKNSGSPTSKNLRENRAKEKKIVAQNELIMNQEMIEEDKTELLLQSKTAINSDEETVSFEDAFASFKELEDELYG